MGEAFEEVSNEMDELVNGFYPAAVVGDTTVGITVYVVWFTLAMIAMLAVLFAYKRSIEGRLVPHGVFANAVDYGVDLPVKVGKYLLCRFRARLPGGIGRGRRQRQAAGPEQFQCQRMIRASKAYRRTAR